MFFVFPQDYLDFARIYFGRHGVRGLLWRRRSRGSCRSVGREREGGRRQREDGMV